MKLEKILKSQGLYYVALVLMVVNVLGYVSVGSMECVIVFAISYYLSNSYTKNQSVDILVGLFVANVVFGCGRVREGMENPVKKIDKVAADVMTEAKHKESKKKCSPGDKECAARLKEASKHLNDASKKVKEATKN